MKNENEPRFIPCGDSLERMQEIPDANLEAVSGGNNQETQELKTTVFDAVTDPEIFGIIIHSI